MALDTVDEAVKLGGLSPQRPSQTETVKLVGAADYSPAGAGALQERFGLELDIASHLNGAYGDQAFKVAELAQDGLGTRLSPEHPYLEAEVVYGARLEGACTLTDVLARRLRLGFLDQAATQRAVPRAAQLLGDALGWSEARRNEEAETARRHFGDPVLR